MDGRAPRWRPGWLAAALLLVPEAVGCSPVSNGRAPAPTAGAAPSLRPGPPWLYDIPSGCALGDSGPTLRPTDAIADAGRRARARLLAAPIQSRSLNVDRSDGDREDRPVDISHERAAGWVNDSEVVALWYDADGLGPEHAAGCAYAAACLVAGLRPEAAQSWIGAQERHRGGPPWIYGLARRQRRLCGLGISGPTLDPQDAPVNAEAAAREQLALAISLHASTTMAIFEDDEVMYSAVTAPCAGCEERAGAGQVVERWLDQRGVGPMPAPGSAYVLMCLDE